MSIDWTISLGNIIQIIVIAGGGVTFLLTMKVTVDGLKGTVDALKDDVSAVQDDIKAMGHVLTKMAVAETRLDNIETRQTNTERDIRDLRRGEGFIRGPSGIDREFT